MARMDITAGEVAWHIKVSCGHWTHGMPLHEVVRAMTAPYLRCGARTCPGGAPTGSLKDDYETKWTFAQVASGEWLPPLVTETKVHVQKRSDGFATRWRKKIRGEELLAHYLDWQCTFCENKSTWHQAPRLDDAFAAWDEHKASTGHINNVRTSDAVDRVLRTPVPGRRRSSETAAADRFPSGE